MFFYNNNKKIQFSHFTIKNKNDNRLQLPHPRPPHQQIITPLQIHKPPQTLHSIKSHNYLIHEPIHPTHNPKIPNLQPHLLLQHLITKNPPTINPSLPITQPLLKQNWTVFIRWKKVKKLYLPAVKDRKLWVFWKYIDVCYKD